MIISPRVDSPLIIPSTQSPNVIRMSLKVVVFDEFFWDHLDQDRLSCGAAKELINSFPE